MSDGTFEPGRAQDLTAIIARHVPLTVLGEAVAQLGLMPDFAIVRRAAPAEVAKAQIVVTKQVVEKAIADRAVPALVNAISGRLWQDSDLVSLLHPFRQFGASLASAQQAAIARRAHTMRLPNLTQRLADWAKWICVIAAVLNDGTLKFGTGVLVGPDLVLTVFHNVRRHIENDAEAPASHSSLYAIFDYHDIAPLPDVDNLPAGAVRVPFAEKWLVAKGEDLHWDGTIGDPDSDQVTELKAKLDFALVKLAKPIGNFSLTENGGPRRSWLALTDHDDRLRVDDRIIIPQHPAGAGQSIDFGRFMQFDASATRLRYSTETERGTSGAPCFNQQFKLVGLHNATFQPQNVTVANQAIAIGCIVPLLKASAAGNELVPPAAQRAASVWNVSSDNAAPRVVLGRATLQTWLEQAASNPARRAERVYAAACRGSGPDGTKGFGKTFTIDVLRAARRHSADRIVVLGGPDALLPASAPDVVRSIGEQLGIDPEILKDVPKRPADGPTGPQGSDKLLKWASEEIPAWFDGVLARRRVSEFDEVANAREYVALLNRQGEAVPARMQELASSPAPKYVTRTLWDMLWIALDRIAESRMSDEVKNLLSGLVGGKAEEGAVPAERRRLRWLFLGYVPDFLADGEVTAEILDPMQIGADAFIEAMQNHAATTQATLDEAQVKLVRRVVNGFIAVMPVLQNPNLRLPQLQLVFPEATKP